jgi:hypothetical protein
VATTKLYNNNFKGRSGRTERAKHLRDEFTAIEEAFTRLQALNIATYLTVYTNSTVLSGVVTISPDNGFLQELTITTDTAIQLASPLNEEQYRLSLLIHGSSFKITNLWGAQTWKEYGLGNWWELYTGEGPYASMLLEFYWDICSLTWICVASSKNQFNLLPGGVEQRFYPLVSHLTNLEGDDTLGFTRTTYGMIWDQTQAHWYIMTGFPRFAGARYVDNWVAKPSDLTHLSWVVTNVTVATVAGAGPASEDVQRLTFTATGGKVATFILPAFGRASRQADPLKIAVSFKAKAVSGTAAVRVVNAFMGKTGLTPPQHHAVQVNLTSSWQTYGAILDVTGYDPLAEDFVAQTALVLSETYPRTLMEISFMSPSGSEGSPIYVTDVQVEVLRHQAPERCSEFQEGTLGASMVLSATGTGTWVDGTKTLTLASVGKYVEFNTVFGVGKTYLVHARLQSGDACDIRMQYEQTVWAAGPPTDPLYLQQAPFTFQYEGGHLKFVLVAGSSSVYLVDIYEMAANRSVYGLTNESSLSADHVLTYATGVGVTSNILDGVAREVASDNLVGFQYMRGLSYWDSVGLSGVENPDCKRPVAQTEYGIDMWPSRASLLQGTSKVANGFVQLVFTIPQVVRTHDFSIYIRRAFDANGVQIVTPQHEQVAVPPSEYIDVVAQLTGGASNLGGGVVRIRIKDGAFDTDSLANYAYIGIVGWKDWWRVDLSLANDGLHNGFRVQIYPSPAKVFDPSVIDVTAQGWVILDWAQFEVQGGTWTGSSPIVGHLSGVTRPRAIEDFTSLLPTGEFYRTDNTHVAHLDGGTNAITWDLADEVYKNLVYSSVIMIPDIVPRNMHEFGLVQDESIPQSFLTLVTSTLYPIEVKEALLFAISLSSGAMYPINEDQMDLGHSLTSGTLRLILKTTGPYEDQMDLGHALSSGTLRQILKSTGPYEDQLDLGHSLTSGALDQILIETTAPEEALEFSISLDSSNCSMTPV